MPHTVCPGGTLHVRKIFPVRIKIPHLFCADITAVLINLKGRHRILDNSSKKGLCPVSYTHLDVFAAPGPQACLDAIKLADKGKGVLYIVLNHAGDMLTGNLTMKKCAKEGLNVVKVVTQEDIANAPRSNADDRRGLVGCIPTYKIAGAAAAEGKSLEEVAAIAQRFADNMATLAVAVSGATHPATGSLLADLGEDEMEIGMGQDVYKRQVCVQHQTHPETGDSGTDNI